VRRWAAEIAALHPTIPFYDTVNRNQDPQDDVWWTVDFFPLTMDGTFCERGYVETGYVYVDVFAAPGRGDMEAIQAMEIIIPEMFGKVDPTQRLVLESYDPLEEASGGSARQSYQVTVGMLYQHSL